MTTIHTVRILQDDRNRDGWIAKLLSSDATLSGKICFIANLDYTIQDLYPGQRWEAQAVEQTERFWLVNLTSRL